MSEIDRLARKRSLRGTGARRTILRWWMTRCCRQSPTLCCATAIPKTETVGWRRLEQLPDYPALVGHQSVGQLMTSGKLEKAIHAIGEPETRRVQASHSVSRFLAELEGGHRLRQSVPKSRRATDKASS